MITKSNRRSRKRIVLGLRIAVLIALFLVICTAGSQARYNGYRVVGSGVVVATAYNSLESQTDDSPWITASGTRCHRGVVASNFLPFGTKLMIEGFGNRIFVVEDRMHKRYSNRLDIWFKDYPGAKEFGVRKVKYYILASA